MNCLLFLFIIIALPLLCGFSVGVSPHELVAGTHASIVVMNSGSAPITYHIAHLSRSGSIDPNSRIIERVIVPFQDELVIEFSESTQVTGEILLPINQAMTSIVVIISAAMILVLLCAAWLVLRR